MSPSVTLPLPPVCTLFDSTIVNRARSLICNALMVAPLRVALYCHDPALHPFANKFGCASAFVKFMHSIVIHHGANTATAVT